MTHTHAKGQGQKSLGSKVEWKQSDGQTTDGQTEATALRAVLTRSVIKPATSHCHFARPFMLRFAYFSRAFY